MTGVNTELVLTAIAAMLSPTTVTFSVLALVLGDRPLRTGSFFYLGAFSWPILLHACGYLFACVQQDGPKWYCLCGLDPRMPEGDEYPRLLSNDGFSVTDEEAKIIAAIRGKLHSSPFADAPIVPTSIFSGRGIAELKATLASVLSRMSPPPDLGKPRLSVDRVFTLHGIGTVVTGTLTGGSLRRGQPVIVQPSGRVTRIRNLQSHNQDVESVRPGTRTALNLPDLAVAAKRSTPLSDAGVRRGEVVTLP